MLAAQGILTARGGLVSHAAVVARGWGKPAVVGAEALRIGGPFGRAWATSRWPRATGSRSTAPTGTVVLGPGAADGGRAQPPSSSPSWSGPTRSARGHLEVRANADTGADAANARRLGAEGIGLCRTEHMFLAEDRLPIVRRMILADTPEEEKAALEELRVAQRADFVEILEAMDGLPVTVRLLDPPLHEFLPSTHELAIKEATVGPRRRGAAPLRGGQVVAGGQPDARHPRRPPRGHQARPLRHAGARAHGGGGRPGQAGRAPRSSRS